MSCSVVYAKILEGFSTQATSDIELIYTPRSSWPLQSSEATGHCERSLTISVLDSSFNPPTSAHLALASLPSVKGDSITTSCGFDAKLLLFSTKNADKTIQSGDATPSQRLEMMVLLARELQSIGEQSRDRGSQNIAVAVCKEPTFVGKSAALKNFLGERMAAMSSPGHVQLTFLLGFDTLERLFSPKYYGSESAMNGALQRFLSASGDGSKIICARRSSGTSYTQTDTSVLEAAKGYLNSGSVVLTDIGELERTLSSSEIREAIRNRSKDWERKVPIGVALYIKENHVYVQS